MRHKRVLARLAVAALLAAGIISGAAAPANAGAAAPANAGAATSRAVDTCTGSNRYDAYVNSGNRQAHLYGWFWSISGGVCVGQADLFEDVVGGSGFGERVRVRDGGANGTILYEHTSRGTINGDSITFVTHVNRVFFVSVVTVCAAVVHQSDNSVVPNTIVCKAL
jgi:hypothetical protein